MSSITTHNSSSNYNNCLMPFTGSSSGLYSQLIPSVVVLMVVHSVANWCPLMMVVDSAIN